MTSVGVVGLGLIGSALVHRLAQTGEAPLVFDLKSQAVNDAVAVGATAADSSADLAARSDIVLVCVQTDDQCIDAVRGEKGALAGATPDTCIAVVSTVLPSTIESLAAAAAEQGVHLVDTPVAGRGAFSVEEGTMSVMVGDDGELAARLEPTLRRFASKVVAAGALGSGAALKLAHNVVVYAGLAAMMEAVDLADAAGVRDGLLEDVAKTSGALSDLSAFTLPYFKHFRENPPTEFVDEALKVAAQLQQKDLGDAVFLAGEHGVDMPIARLLSHSRDAIFQSGR